MSKQNEKPREAESTSTGDEPKLTPLQRVKQQQALLRQNRNGGGQRPGAGGGAHGHSGGANRRAHMNRRSGGS